MLDDSILGYSLNEIGFLSAKHLTYQGIHTCYVIKKIIHKGSMEISVSSQYHLEVISESKDYKGVIYVDGCEFDKAKEGRKIGNYSIITNKNGIVRFSKELSESAALRDVINVAKKIVFQTVLVVLFLGIPTLIYWFYIFTMFFNY